MQPLPFPADLDRLVDALTAIAEQDASAMRATAAADARETTCRADDEARLEVEAAKRTGARAAERTAGRRRAEGRREAQELVQTARRRVLDRLRTEAVAHLSAQMDRPEGQELRRYLCALVADTAGVADAELVRTGRGLAVVAPVTGGRAELFLEDLVDQILASLGEEVDSLWR